MLSSSSQKKLRNGLGHLLFHPFVIYMTLWLTGALVAYVTGEIRYVTIDNSAIYILLKWAKWLKSVWSALPFASYNYLKPKLVLTMIIPSFAVILAYYKFRHQIIKIQFFKQLKENVYGDAHWATEDDIERAGLRAKDGMVIGEDDEGLFIVDGWQSCLLFAPTGAGKGAAIIIPTLLTYTQSVVCHDVKLENYEKTSGYRASKLGHEVYVWNPADPDGVTHCYNPLDWISHKPGQMVDDVQKIANLLTAGSGGGGNQDFWNAEARSLFVGIVTYLIADTTKIRSLGEVTRTLRSDDVAYNLAIALDTLGKLMHPVGYMNLTAFLGKADKERSGVISTLNSLLELWANPLLDTATASSDFNFMDLKRKKMTIFVGVSPDNVQRLQKLMQVFYQQATEFLSRKLPNLKEEPIGVLFLMDEFPTLGKMDQFKSGIAFFRGYRVRLLLIVQDTQQLKAIYEDSGMNSFLSNSTYRITYAANNIETAEMISKTVGMKTVEQASFNKPTLLNLNIFSATKNTSQTQRALLLPQEVMQLPKDEEIILIEAFPPIKCRKNWYFKKSFYMKRILPQTPVPTQEPYDPRKSKSAVNTEKT